MILDIPDEQVLAAYESLRNQFSTGLTKDFIYSFCDAVKAWEQRGFSETWAEEADEFYDAWDEETTPGIPGSRLSLDDFIARCPQIFDLAAHIERQRKFSLVAFGPIERKHAVVEHIRSELKEIEAAPDDLEEWIDVMILAIEGAWRAGHSPEAIAQALSDKQAKNEARTWPDWREVPEGGLIEHEEPKSFREGARAFAENLDRLPDEIKAMSGVPGDVVKGTKKREPKR